MMKKKMIIVLGMIAALGMNIPVIALAANQEQDDFQTCEQAKFAKIVNEIEGIKRAHLEYTEDEILNLMNGIHLETDRGVVDIWNSLTGSEKKLCIRYPFDALKVNEAKDIATEQTLKRFNKNGLGDRSDAF